MLCFLNIMCIVFVVGLLLEKVISNTTLLTLTEEKVCICIVRSIIEKFTK